MSPRTSNRARSLAVVLAIALGGGSAVALEVLPEDAANVRTAAIGEVTPLGDAPRTDAAALAVGSGVPLWAGASRPSVPGEADSLAAVSVEVDDFAARLEEARRQEAVAAERGAIWDRLADCESGDWDRNSQPIPGSRRWDYGLTFSHGDIFEGGLNFHPKTWDQYRSSSMADHAGNATRAQQIAVAEQVLDDQGWGAWPVCSRKLGYR